MHKLVIFPDPILKQISEPVKQITDEDKALIKEMIDIMFTNKGVGISAPQLGELKRIIIVNCGFFGYVMINPKIVDRVSHKLYAIEGCLSLPGVEILVERDYGVTVEYQEISGKIKTEEFVDWDARVVQHEIDHLDGILILEREHKGE